MFTYLPRPASSSSPISIRPSIIRLMASLDVKHHEEKKNTLQLGGWNERTAGPPTSSRERQAARSGRRELEVRSGGWCPSGEENKHRHKGRLSEGRDPAKGSSRHPRLAYSVSLTPLCFFSLTLQDLMTLQSI